MVNPKRTRPHLGFCGFAASRFQGLPIRLVFSLPMLRLVETCLNSKSRAPSGFLWLCHLAVPGASDSIRFYFARAPAGYNLVKLKRPGPSRFLWLCRLAVPGASDPLRFCFCPVKVAVPGPCLSYFLLFKQNSSSHMYICVPAVTDDRTRLKN